MPALFARTTPVAIPLPVLLGILAIAAALSLPRTTWQYFGLFATLVHELGHAVAAILTGRMVHGIRIRRNHSGDAMSSGRGIFGTVVSGVFGYPAPAIVGAAQLWSVFNGYTAIALFSGGIVLVLTLIVIRNVFGAVVVLSSAAVSALLWFSAPAPVQGYALLVIGVALLVGSVRALGCLPAVPPHGNSVADLASALRRTHRWMLRARGLVVPRYLIPLVCPRLFERIFLPVRVTA